MDFQSAMEIIAEAWVATNTRTPLTEAAETQAGLMLSGGSVCDMNPDRRDAAEPGLTSPLNEFRPIPKPSPTSQSGRDVPVHCIVEQASPPGQPSVESVDVDKYAIIPGNVPFAELVPTALQELNYSPAEALAAKGAIQLKNWKPLTFDQITESAEATVGDILGELTTVATLRIRLYSRPKHHSSNDVKEKLLQVLLAQSQNLLVSSGCPIDQSVLSALTKGRHECDIPDDTRKKFDQWYLQQVFQHCRQVALLQQQHQHHQQQQQQQQQQPQQQPPQQTAPPPLPPPPLLQIESGSPPHGGRTRIRTSFDPELELPKLHRWFSENQHPSRLQIQQYVRELNALESRRGRKPLDVNNVVYWFKNARAAHKRAEQKCCPPSAPESNGRGQPHSPTGSSQQNSSDDSDNIHTLDLSVRRVYCEPLQIKEEPRDSSCSEHSIESSEDEEMTVEEEKQNGVEELPPPYRLEERRKRNRTFIDPVSEVPRLEQWFSANTHPSHSQIVRFTQELNGMQYRQKFPKLEPKNIQFWFKNRRAKCKRLNLAANLQTVPETLMLPENMMLPAN